ncbi:MAG: SpoIIE family protein phosphatase [Balneolaceae bacterium]
MTTRTSDSEKQSRFALKTVLETSRMLIESRESDFILNNLLFITMGKLLVSRAAILIKNASTDDYVIKRMRGKSIYNEGDSVNINLPVGKWQKAVYDLDEYSDKFPELFENMSGGLFFNLRTSNHHLGFLYLNKKVNGNPFEPNELEFIESLCIISSVALANSQLFDELKKTNKNLDRRLFELNTLLEISKEFNLLTNRDQIARVFKFSLLGQLLIRTFFLIYLVDGKPKLLTSNGLTTYPDEKELQELFDLEDQPAQIDNEHQDKLPFLRENKIVAVSPISIQNSKTAVIGIGERISKEQYTQSDFNFLQSLGNLTVLTIQKTYLIEERIEKERLEEELAIAKSIQRGLLPDPIPDIPGLDTAAVNVSSRSVGGDYFDIAQTPLGDYVFAIADVTGKGTPAALLMANLQSMLHVLLPVDISLDAATDRINEIIFKNTPSDKFITFFWGIYYHKETRFRYVNAGHNPPLLLRNGSNTFETLDTGGLLLGAMQTITPYEEESILLEKGDLLFMYTDGVTEAYNHTLEEEFEEERLKNLLLKNRDKSSQDIMNIIIDEVKRFGEESTLDDLTMIVLKVK